MGAIAHPRTATLVLAHTRARTTVGQRPAASRPLEVGVAVGLEWAWLVNGCTPPRSIGSKSQRKTASESVGPRRKS